MNRLIWISLAGAAGTATRYLIAVWSTQRFGPGFPVGTLIVNLVGCFVIAAVVHAATVLAWPVTLRTTITVGFLGGLTTYSSFNNETIGLVQNGATETAALNALLTIGGGWIAGWSGLLLAKQWLGQ